MAFDSMRSWDPDVPHPKLRRLLVVLALLGLAGVVLMVVLFGDPSAGAAGGCGGG